VREERWFAEATVPCTMGQGRGEERVAPPHRVGVGREAIRRVQPGGRVAAKRPFGLGIEGRSSRLGGRRTVLEVFAPELLLLTPEGLVLPDDPGPGEVLQRPATAGLAHLTALPGITKQAAEGGSRRRRVDDRRLAALG